VRETAVAVVVADGVVSVVVVVTIGKALEWGEKGADEEDCTAATDNSEDEEDETLTSSMETDDTHIRA